MTINPEIERYYNRGGEVQRLDKRCGLEKYRTQEIIQRYLRDEPMDILDVGGATGVYAFWLSEMGHRVNLIDPVAFQIEYAVKINETSQYPLKSIAVGDARKLDYPDESFDLVLMLGPLYHLIRQDERIIALKEAKRVVRKNGYVISAIITHTAGLLDGVCNPVFLRLLKPN